MTPEDEFLKQFNEHFGAKRFEGGDGPEIPPEEVEARRGRELHEKEVKVHGVYEHPQGGMFVLLRDSRQRNLPIWIGQSEAVSIHVAIEGNAPTRPMTHDLMKLLLDRTGASVDYILVDDLYNNVFYAKIALRHNGKPNEIDCRPSDAIAMALRYRTPIYVAEHVLEEGQWQFSEE